MSWTFVGQAEAQAWLVDLVLTSEIRYNTYISTVFEHYKLKPSNPETQFPFQIFQSYKDKFDRFHIFTFGEPQALAEFYDSHPGCILGYVESPSFPTRRVRTLSHSDSKIKIYCLPQKRVILRNRNYS